jgi:hypothetical protein
LSLQELIHITCVSSEHEEYDGEEREREDKKKEEEAGTRKSERNNFSMRNSITNKEKREEETRVMNMKRRMGSGRMKQRGRGG